MIDEKSAIVSLVFNGFIFHVLTPWNIIIDFGKLTITVKKRNWFLIGHDENIVPFRYIRNIEIDRHLFGASMKIKAYGSGTIVVKAISKVGADKIKDELIKYNNANKIKGMIV